MDNADEQREKSRAFYSNFPGQPGPATQEANVLNNRALREVLPALLTGDDFALLDIGCGRGRVTRIVKDLFPQAQVFGTDISAEQIAHARGFVPDGVFQVANEIDLPFDDASFDYITCRMSIHHYPDLPRHLQEVKRVLRPGGRYLIIDIVSSAGMQDRWLNEVFLTAERETSGDGHLKFYTVEEYEGFLTAAGFILEQQESLPHLLAWGKSGDYWMSIYRSLLRAPEEFRESVHFVEEEELYRWELPGRVLVAVKP